LLVDGKARRSHHRCSACWLACIVLLLLGFQDPPDSSRQCGWLLGMHGVWGVHGLHQQLEHYDLVFQVL
jgi:hypothetical protein